MAKYAKGTHAKGRCGRCGDKADYLDMVDDGQFPGLRVHPECRDIKHPVERPWRGEDGIALKYPAPDIEDDSGIGINDANETLLDALFTTTTISVDMEYAMLGSSGLSASPLSSTSEGIGHTTVTTETETSFGGGT